MPKAGSVMRDYIFESKRQPNQLEGGLLFRVFSGGEGGGMFTGAGYFDEKETVYGHFLFLSNIRSMERYFFIKLLQGLD